MTVKHDRTGAPPLRMIAWEVTRNCNLNCVHCRASAELGPYPEELTRDECFRLIDDIASFSKPVVILTGGEPLLRGDIFDIAAYGHEAGLRMVMAVNGTLLTSAVVDRMKAVGIQRISVSIDGSTPELHDTFRQVKGAFAAAVQGVGLAKQAGLEFQINTTITKRNLTDLPSIYALAVAIGAVAHHIFVLVPTGRGKDLAREERVMPEEYDRVLHWFCEQEKKASIQVKATCAPQYYRIRREVLTKEERQATDHSSLASHTRGCLGGVSFCFISHQGMVAPCGYLELDCGNVRCQTLEEIWSTSEIIQSLRQYNLYQGKCGVCEYVNICGGCRARAYYSSGNFLADDPNCTYQPQRMK